MVYIAEMEGIVNFCNRLVKMNYHGYVPAQLMVCNFRCTVSVTGT